MSDLRLASGCMGFKGKAKGFRFEVINLLVLGREHGNNILIYNPYIIYTVIPYQPSSKLRC